MTGNERRRTKEAIVQLLDKAGERELRLIWRFVRGLLEEAAT